MESLPDDVLLEVFSFLSQRDLLKAALVSKSWKRLSHDSSLWWRLNLEPFANSLREDIILRLISTRFAPLGRQMILDKTTVTSMILQGLFDSCHKVEFLSLNNCKFQEAGLWFELEQPQIRSLRFIDLRNANGYATGVEDILRQCYNVEYLGLHVCISPRVFIRIFANKRNLRILDCGACEWINDDNIRDLAFNCLLLESVCFTKCRNVQGRTLSSLLQNCKRLKTLILEGTQIKDEYVGRADWSGTNIVELNVLSCYRLSVFGLSAALPNLKRLRYLKCALTDEVLRLLAGGFPHLEVFLLHRRYPVTVQCVSDLLCHCPMVTCLDISSIPLAFVYFEGFLPCLPRLRLLNFAGNELLGTEKIIRSLGTNCPALEVVSVNYFHTTSNFEIERSFVFLVQKCARLKQIILNGLFVSNLVVSIRSLAYHVCSREDVIIEENKRAFLPGPQNSLDNFRKSIGFNTSI